MLEVPRSLQRLAIEIDGWLDLGCPEHALEKLGALLRNPGARSAGLYLRVRAQVDLGRFGQALRTLEKLRNFHHDPDWFDLTEAWCLKRMDDLQGAVTCMERLLKRSHRSAIGHFNLGCYLALLGNKERALEEVSVACGMEPSFREAAVEEPDLASLRDDPDFKALVGQA